MKWRQMMHESYASAMEVPIEVMQRDLEMLAMEHEFRPKN